MTNPVLILTHNNLDLTRRCVESVLAQDIETQIQILDNASTDGMDHWIKPMGVLPVIYCKENLGVSKGWNDGLTDLFSEPSRDHVLVIGNDTVLPSWFYSTLLSYDLPFVSGVAVDNMEQIVSLPERTEPVPNPDFSAWLIKRSVWEKVGPFSDAMVSWASDCDFHVRAHRLGINLLKVNVPFYHVHSRTIELAPTREKRMLEMQADSDRMTFSEIWKCRVGSPQYAELFSEESFGIDL